MKATKCMGAVAQRCCAVVSVALGGQILCDSATLEGIRGHLADLYKGCIRSDAQRTSAPSMRLCHFLQRHTNMVMSRRQLHRDRECGKVTITCALAAGLPAPASQLPLSTRGLSSMGISASAAAGAVPLSQAIQGTLEIRLLSCILARRHQWGHCPVLPQRMMRSHQRVQAAVSTGGACPLHQSGAL